MDGLLIIDKPAGPTSHDVVLKIRHKIGQQRIGHTGTLDPFATGVLVLALGKATKLVNKLSSQDKEYDVILTLGIKTDTGDITGKIISRHEIGKIETKKVEQSINKFKGLLDQIPPMVSAKKYKGRPLYKYARQGEIVYRAPKKIFIHKIELKSIALPHIYFSVHCSKGTYIRTLCEDIGGTLGTSGCASGIRRTKNGIFGIEQAVCLDELLKLGINEIEKKVIPC